MAKQLKEIRLPLHNEDGIVYDKDIVVLTKNDVVKLLNLHTMESFDKAYETLQRLQFILSMDVESRPTTKEKMIELIHKVIHKGIPISFLDVKYGIGAYDKYIEFRTKFQ